MRCVDYSNKLQGNIGEAEAIRWYASQGYEIYIPFTAGSKADILVEKDDIIKRIQVKSTSFRAKESENFRVNLSTFGGNRSWSGKKTTISSKYVDEVFVYSLDGAIWIFPVEVVEGKKSQSLSAQYKEYHVAGPEPRGPISGVPKQYLDTNYPKNKPRSTSKKPNKECTTEGCPNKRTGESKFCTEHYKTRPQQFDWPPLDEVVSLVRNTNYYQASKQLGVSDNAIRKLFKRNNIEL